MATSGYDGTISINTTIQTGDINAQFDEMSNSLRDASEKLFNGVQEGAKKGQQAVTASFGTTAAKVKDGLSKATQAADTEQKKLSDSAKKINSAIASSMKGTEGIVARTMAKIGGLSVSTFLGIVAGAAVLAAIGAMFVSAFKEMDKMPMYAAAVNQLKGSFSALKNQFATLAAPLVALFLPVLQTVIDSLIQAVNIAAQIIAALTGQDTYMQAIASSSGEYAGNMQDAEKAAKGQLAAFDRLNVLTENAATTPGGGGSVGNITWKEIPLSKEVTQFKKELADLGWFNAIMEALYRLLTPVREWIQKNVLDPLQEAFSKFGEWVKRTAENIWEWIKNTWSAAGEWFKNNVTAPIAGWFTSTWGTISQGAITAWNDIKQAFINAYAWFQTNVIDPIKGYFSSQWDEIGKKVTGTWESVKAAWQIAAQWFEDNVFTGIKNGWELVKEAFTSGLQTSEVSIGKSLIEAVNTFAGAINTTFANIERTINNWIATIKNALPAWMTSNLNYINLPQISLLDTGSSPYFQESPYPPGLASGAVLPPNAPFMAIVGDQKRGVNVEAPLATIEQAVENALSRRSMGGQNGTISFDVDESGLMRYLHPKFTAESMRIGNSLARKAGTV